MVKNIIAKSFHNEHKLFKKVECAKRLIISGPSPYDWGDSQEIDRYFKNKLNIKDVIIDENKIW